MMEKINPEEIRIEKLNEAHENITKDSLIEAKYNQELEKNQKKLFDTLKIKNKIVAKGYLFFIQEI